MVTVLVIMTIRLKKEQNNKMTIECEDVPLNIKTNPVSGYFINYSLDSKELLTLISHKSIS